MSHDGREASSSEDISVDELDHHPQDRDDSYDEKKGAETEHLENAEVYDGKEVGSGDVKWTCPPEWHLHLRDEYTGKHEGESLPPGADVDRAVEAILTLSPDESVAVLKEAQAAHARDLTFMDTTRARITHLVQGHEACEMDYDDWAYETSKLAGKIHSYSPYPEVRSVSLPYDDVDEPCETIRAWFLGMFWLIGVTVVNTFFAPRQPGISIPGAVVQLFLVPMGHACARLLPDWGFTFRGKRHSLNPGPWTVKEQLMATIIQSAAGSGNYGGLLALRMPMFFNQKWVKFGFEICLGLANQVFGLGGAGLLRRLTVYPVQAVWPQSLPTLALVRTLIHHEKNRNEVISGWRMSRWVCFMISTIVFMIWYWFPNNLANVLQRFDWMAWIKPNNFNLNIVTGSYGGMGFNPVSTFDPNYSGNQAMMSPFFAQFQQYILRVFGGIIILILYYSNYMWGAYLPINSGTTFTNKMEAYNSTSILADDMNTIDLAKYRAYSPPYLTTAMQFKTGGEFAFYTITFVYVFIRYWRPIWRAFHGIYQNVRHRRSDMHGYDDAHTRMMRSYPEVPEWWFMIILGGGFILTVVTLEVYPTGTPWWSVLAFVGLGYCLLIPWCIVESIAATGIGFDAFWHLMPGLWWPGKLVPHLVIVMLGSAFEAQAGGFMIDLKYAQYAHLPPRAVFRGHVVSTIVNVFFYVIIVDWLVTGYSSGTMCQMDDPQLMVCQWPRQTWTNTIFYGLFGTKRMFKIYPILPWCFLIGALIGLVWAVTEVNAPALKRKCAAKLSAARYAALERGLFAPAATLLGYINPAIAVSGMLNWGGQTNLSMATTGIYIAWFFQYYLKRYHTAWWSKYAYILFAGLSVGVTISGLISTLAFGFGAGAGKSLKWWGNQASKDTLNYQAFTDKPGGVLKSVPEKGWFGLSPDQYP